MDRAALADRREVDRLAVLDLVATWSRTWMPLNPEPKLRARRGISTTEIAWELGVERPVESRARAALLALERDGQVTRRRENRDSWWRDYWYPAETDFDDEPPAGPRWTYY